MNTLWFFKKNRKVKNKPDKSIKFGQTDIILPANHMLDVYMKSYPRYDQSLGEIARIMYQQLGFFNAIDIGANVGDSAALICKYQSIPVLCIEGCDAFIPYLKKNASIIGNHIKVAEYFVGAQSTVVDRAFVDVQRGTASIAQKFLPAKQDTLIEQKATVKTLDDILCEHESFKNAALIKIDTDGYDFLIILHSLDCFKECLPVLFFEYDTSYEKNNAHDALAAIDALWHIGYRHFLIYDNFGNFLIALHDKDSFDDLNVYLATNRKSKRIIYYFDVCAIGDDKVDIFRDIKNYEKSYSL